MVGTLFAGARVDVAVPLAPLTTLRVGPVAPRVITCTSTDDTIAFGLTGCRQAVPGLGAMTGHLDDELRQLERAAGV